MDSICCYTTRWSVQISMFQKTFPWNMRIYSISSSSTTSWRCVDSRSSHSFKKKLCPTQTKKSNTRNMPSWDCCSSPNPRHLHGQIREFLVLPGSTLPHLSNPWRIQWCDEFKETIFPDFFLKVPKSRWLHKYFHPGHENGLPMSNLSKVRLITSHIRGPPCFPPSLSTVYCIHCNL